MEQIFHGQFSLYDAAIFGYKYIKYHLKPKGIARVQLLFESRAI